MLKRIVLLLMPAAVAGVLLCGCSPPFPKELMDQVDRGVSFADLKGKPDRFRGKLVMLGGTIVELRNVKAGTQMEVLQRPVDREGRPEYRDVTGGRFLVDVPEFLDAAVYQSGRAVTIIGTVDGERMQPLSEIEYRYPVLTAKQVHLWPPYTGPRFSIGIGVSRGF
jgi:outer membrane lipoprotein